VSYSPVEDLAQAPNGEIAPPARYSYSIVNRSDYFTVSFFPEPRCKALEIAGRLHGNQCCKVKETGLTPQFDRSGVYFAEADSVFLCRKIYHTDVEEPLFDSKDVFKGSF
jgi:hypothetical protein